MANFYVLAGIVAIGSAIIWASRQGKPDAPTNLNNRPPAEDKPPHPMAWIGFSLLGVGLLVMALVMSSSPGEPNPSSAKWVSVAMYFAWWLMGDYGPTIMFLGLGVWSLHKAYHLIRDL